MIVCLCHRVSDHDIRRAVNDDGLRNFEVLQDQTRVSSSCGSCLECAREVFDTACAGAGGCGRSHSSALEGAPIAFR